MAPDSNTAYRSPSGHRGELCDARCGVSAAVTQCMACDDAPSHARGHLGYVRSSLTQIAVGTEAQLCSLMSAPSAPRVAAQGGRVVLSPEEAIESETVRLGQRANAVAEGQSPRRPAPRSPISWGSWFHVSKEGYQIRLNMGPGCPLAGVGGR